MKILSVDTSTPRLYVVLAEDNEILASVVNSENSTHAKNLMPAIDEVLREAETSLEDIDVFACSVGPGSYTGIRIGVSTIQALAYAQGKPCLALNTLDILAYSELAEDKLVVSLLDARNRRVYAKAFLGYDEFIAAGVGGVDQLFTVVNATIAEKKLQVNSIALSTDDKAIGYADDLKLAEIVQQKLVASPPYYAVEALAQFTDAKAQTKQFIEASALLPLYYQATEAERNFNYFVD